MKNVLIAMVVFGSLIIAPNTHAQTLTDAEREALIVQLWAQVIELQAQIAALQENDQDQEVSTTTPTQDKSIVTILENAIDQIIEVAPAPRRDHCTGIRCRTIAQP